MTHHPSAEKAREFLSFVQAGIITLTQNWIKEGQDPAHFSMLGTDVLVADALRASERIPDSMNSSEAAAVYLSFFGSTVEKVQYRVPTWFARFDNSDHLSHNALEPQEQFVWLVKTMLLLDFGNRRRPNYTGSQAESHTLEIMLSALEKAAMTAPSLPKNPRGCFVEEAHRLIEEFFG